jgi:hypothetical protein
VLFDFIERASTHVIMDSCGCRTRITARTPTGSVLFMARAFDMPVGAGRKVTRRASSTRAGDQAQLVP